MSAFIMTATCAFARPDTSCGRGGTVIHAGEARAMLEYESLRHVDNAGVAIAVESRGDGARHLVFAHGWISSRRMFYDVVERLDAARFTSHLLDFRGSGLSDRPATGYDVEGYASDLRAAIASVPHPVTLVAHSMGGKIAQFVALEPPPNLTQLVLLAPGSAKALPPNERHRALALDAFGSRVKIERFQKAAMTRAISVATMTRVVDDALVASRDAWFGWYEHGRGEHFFDRIPSIVLPTLVIAGEFDPLAPAARVRRDVAGAIPGAAFVTVRNVGHNLPIEAPAEIADILTALAARRDPDRSAG